MIIYRRLLAEINCEPFRGAPESSAHHAGGKYLNSPIFTRFGVTECKEQVWNDYGTRHGTSSDDDEHHVQLPLPLPPQSCHLFFMPSSTGTLKLQSERGDNRHGLCPRCSLPNPGASFVRGPTKVTLQNLTGRQRRQQRRSQVGEGSRLSPGCLEPYLSWISRQHQQKRRKPVQPCKLCVLRFCVNQPGRIENKRVYGGTVIGSWAGCLCGGSAVGARAEP